VFIQANNAAGNRVDFVLSTFSIGGKD